MLRRKEKVCGNNFGAHGFPLLFSVPWKQGYLHLFFLPNMLSPPLFPFSLHCHLCLLFFSRLSSSPPLVLAVLYCIWNAPPFPTVFAPFFSIFLEARFSGKSGGGRHFTPSPAKVWEESKVESFTFSPPLSWFSTVHCETERSISGKHTVLGGTEKRFLRKNEVVKCQGQGGKGREREIFGHCSVGALFPPGI